MRTVLVSTLGDRPGAVTVAIDNLVARRVTPGVIHLLTTSDSCARDAAAMLAEHVPSHYGTPPGSPWVWFAEAYEDIDSEQAALEFMKLACGILRQERAAGTQVYVCIAGGRKTMSALMTLAVQMYGATELFHVLTLEPDVEEGGQIRHLKNLRPEARCRYLHPAVDKVRAVRLPFIGLFPWLGEVTGALAGDAGVRQEVRALLEQNGLVSGLTRTALGEVVYGILQSIESLPEPRSKAPEVKLDKAEPRFRSEVEKWANDLAGRFSFITAVYDVGWGPGRPGAKPSGRADELTVSARSSKGFVFDFRVVTTAKTPGQLKRAAEEIKRHVCS